MSFAQKLSAGIRKHLSSLKELHSKRVAQAEARARRELAEARTKTEREKARLQLKREKIAVRKELYEAQIATHKAKEALKKARKEAGDLTISERLIVTYKGLTRKPRQKPTHKRRKRTHG